MCADGIISLLVYCGIKSTSKALILGFKYGNCVTVLVTAAAIISVISCSFIVSIFSIFLVAILSSFHVLVLSIFLVAILSSFHVLVLFIFLVAILSSFH